MALVHRRCAGLDVHRDTVVACIRTRVARGQYEEQTQTFGTFTADLKRLAEWLKENKVRHAAMESTGVYWVPVWNALEGARTKFELLLVNPAQVRALAGHKTDRIDSARIAEFLQHDRLAGSFIPAAATRDARALERRRVHLQADRNRVTNRIGRLLQTANIKLSSVLSDIVGFSGLRILKAIAEGETSGEKLAELAHGSLKGKKTQLVKSLEGRYDANFRFLLNDLLEELDHLTKKMATITSRLAQHMARHEELIERMCEIPGIDRLTAWTVLAEIGSDMSAFPDADHLASWAALCSGNNTSAGKSKQGRIRKGNRYLKRALVQSAWAAGHSKGTYLSSLFFRFAQRQGMKKAAVSVSHRILVILYYIIRDGVRYEEKGADYFDRLNPEKTARRLLSRLDRLGYDTTAVGRRTQTETAPSDTAPGPQDTATVPERRGRKCKCAERGMPCRHPNRRPEPTPPAAPAQPDACTKCGAWKIACIHVRPKSKTKHLIPNHEHSQ